MKTFEVALRRIGNERNFLMSMETKVEEMKSEGALDGGAMNKLHEVQEAAAGFYEKGLEEARELESKVERYVSRRPMSSLLIAAGVALGAGLLIGTLIKR
jgi:ElaB/YqjD/DUF883 family membrane-anchored ribosome-binding protein